MSVSLAGNLPKGNENGLASISRDLVAALQSRDTRLVIGVVKTSGVKYDEEMSATPTVTITRIEPVPEHRQNEVRSILADLYAERTGATQLDIDGLRDEPEKSAEPEEPQTLELEMGSGYSFEVRDLPAGRFGLYLKTRYGIDAGKRGNLLRSELGEIAPGEYSYVKLPVELRRIADVLIEEWEKNTPASGEDIVDAVVEEDEGYDDSDD